LWLFEQAVCHKNLRDLMKKWGNLSALLKLFLGVIQKQNFKRIVEKQNIFKLLFDK